MTAYRAVAQAKKLGCRLAPPFHLRLVKPNRIQRKIYPAKSALPPKNWRNTSSESENAVCPRETVCVVNTVTTLGAPFSTTGANVVTIPSRVCWGCSATAGNRLMCPHNTAIANNAHALEIPLRMMALAAKGNRTHNHYRLFFSIWCTNGLSTSDLSQRRSGRAVKIERACSRVSVRRVNRTASELVV